MSTTGSHDEFLELCALSTTGELTRDERRRLDSHLATCSSCRQAKKEFETLAGRVIPSMVMEEEAELAAEQEAQSWSLDQAEAKLFRRLRQQEKEKEEIRGIQRHPPDADISLGIESTWRHLWALYAAAVALVLVIGFNAYRISAHRNATPDVLAAARKLPVSDQSAPLAALEEQLSDAGHELSVSQLRISEGDRVISQLRRRLEAQSAEMNQMTASLSALRNEASMQSQQASLARAELNGRMEASQAEVKAMRARLDSLESQAAQDKTRTASLEAEVGVLTHAVDEKQTEIEQQRQLLAHDRDIRELMGARDLYMTEVYDVVRSGETRKPYGRVFYTKDKSLVFYAYDLDQEVSLKNAGTFQVWGRRGPDPEHALKLGIFYQDNTSKKRWVMKCNDSKSLAQIDGVFVTVEPNGSSSRPTSKSFLFAYLKMDPNHP